MELRGLAWASGIVFVMGCKLDFTRRMADASAQLGDSEVADGGSAGDTADGSSDGQAPDSASALDGALGDPSGDAASSDADAGDATSPGERDAGTCSAAESQACSADFPCRPGNGTFTCRGRFVDWPVVARPSNGTGFSVDAAQGTVYDEASGLTWLRSTGNIQRNYAGAAAYCAALGGDYHVPSLAEFSSLLTTPTIPDVDPAVFPDGPGLPYWTSTPANPLVRDQSGLYMLEMGERDGALSITQRSRTELLRVACVRVTEPRFTAAPDARFDVQADYVRDRTTGLSWLRASPEVDYSFGDASAVCARIGQGFRVPTLAELLSLSDPLLPYLGVPASLFSGWPVDAYWTSNVPYGQPGHHYTVNYGVIGGVFSVAVFDDGVGNPIRCVRGP